MVPPNRRERCALLARPSCSVVRRLRNVVSQNGGKRSLTALSQYLSSEYARREVTSARGPGRGSGGPRRSVDMRVTGRPRESGGTSRDRGNATTRQGSCVLDNEHMPGTVAGDGGVTAAHPAHAARTGMVRHATPKTAHVT